MEHSFTRPPNVPITHHHLLDLNAWTAEEIHTVFNTADEMAQILQRRVRKAPALQGFTV